MNIFYLHTHPILAAQYQVDKHVVKMILETAQLLCTAHHVLDNSTDERLYKKTHQNHPSAKWVRESEENYIWLYFHFIGLLTEYTLRYKKTHASQRLTDILINIPKNIPNIPMTKIPCAMPDEYKISNDPVINYREYYKHGKKDLHKWTNRMPPYWLGEKTNDANN